MSENKPYITVYKPIAGWKAILLMWSEDIAMYEPYQTGMCGYGTKEKAIVEAKDWAKAEGIEYREAK